LNKHARVESILTSMNLAQKIGQMTQSERLEASPDDVRKYHLGSILSGGGSHPQGNGVADWLRMADEFWDASMDGAQGRVPVPILYGVDAIHGNNNVRSATIFPHNIGLGAAHDVALMQRIAKVTAREILATGVDWTFAPTLAVAQDIRWGRTYESYSADTTLVCDYAGPFITALQENVGEDGVIACAKHWVGDGGTTYGIDQGETTLAWDEFEALHLAPYYQALEAGVLTVMVSFNSWNGDKCHGHKYLVTDILKGRLGFSGMVVSDWDGIDYLAEDYTEAVCQAVNAGIDMFMVPKRWREFIKALTILVENGRVSMARIDDAVRRILTLKDISGLLDNPRPSARKWSADPGFGSTAHRQVALEAVRKSLVLLKNDAALLPLSKTARVLVAGRNANNIGHQCGGFTLSWQGETSNDTIKGSSIWDGISALAANASLSVDGTGVEADASSHDVAIVVIGERPYAEGMGDIRSGEHMLVEMGSKIKGSMNVLEPYGRSLVLADLHPEDLQCIKNITSAGVPVIVVMVSGRPLVVNAELQEAAAFVAAWLPGSEGLGVAQVLFGEHDFSGSLSFAWPANDVGEGVEPGATALFPMGYGLDYASVKPQA
jgi:beta-glucosidase